jgi:hypothetical protein
MKFVWMSVLLGGVLGLNAAPGCKRPDSAETLEAQKITKETGAHDPFAPHLMRHFRSAEWGYAVEIPRIGFRVRTRTYGRALPPRKFVHRLIVSTRPQNGQKGRRLVKLQLWKNPLQLALEPWFARFAAGLVSDDAQRTTIRATRHETETMLFARGPSPQSPARRQAFFQLGDWMVRLVCLVDDDPAAAKIFDHMLATLRLTDPEEVRP